MAVTDIIKSTAKQVGITATLTNSEKQLKAQLNRLKDHADDPMALIAWDLTTDVTFDINGFLKNPTTPVTMLLMSKADSDEAEIKEALADEMGDLFVSFVKQLRSNLVQYNRSVDNSGIITGAQYTRLPSHGFGKHSGILGRFTMISGLDNC